MVLIYVATLTISTTDSDLGGISLFILVLPTSAITDILSGVSFSPTIALISSSLQNFHFPNSFSSNISLSALYPNSI